MILQDFVAPFYTFRNASYELEYLEFEDELSASKIELKSLATLRSGKRIRKAIDFNFTIDKGRIEKMTINTVSSNIEARWEEADF